VTAPATATHPAPAGRRHRGRSWGDTQAAPSYDLHSEIDTGLCHQLECATDLSWQDRGKTGDALRLFIMRCSVASTTPAAYTCRHDPLLPRPSISVRLPGHGAGDTGAGDVRRRPGDGRQRDARQRDARQQDGAS
jgi:hypothetical protein